LRGSTQGVGRGAGPGKALTVGRSPQNFRPAGSSQIRHRGNFSTDKRKEGERVTRPLGGAEFERNQRLIADNANSKGLLVRGSVRRGEVLLAGLLRCGHCGRKLHVAYGGTAGEAGRYHCKGAFVNHGVERCISFGSLRVTKAVGGEIVRLLKPLGVEAAFNAIAAKTEEEVEKRGRSLGAQAGALRSNARAAPV